MLSALDYHTEGEPMRIVTSGTPALPGRTMLERSERLAAEHDALRRLILFEPRGHAAMCAALLLSPSDPAADAGVVFLEPLGVVHMCGHGAMAIATMLVETGAVAMREPETPVLLDTAAGPVAARVQVRGERVVGVTIRNVPSYSALLDAKVDVPGLGPVAFDLAYGGHFYALVEAAPLGLALTPEEAPRLVEAGEQIRAAIEAEVPLVHPEGDQSRGRLRPATGRPGTSGPTCATPWWWRRPVSTAHRAGPVPPRGWPACGRGARWRRARSSSTSRSSAPASRPAWRGPPASVRTRP
jgi:proline racemase